MESIIFIKVGVVMAIPFIILGMRKKVPILKKKPHILYVAMAVPSAILAYLLLRG